MAELKKLDKNYLLDLIQKLRAEKIRYNRAYRFFCMGEIRYIPFLKKYGIPLINMNWKIREFKDYFADLGVKYPIYAELTDEIYLGSREFFEIESTLEDLMYKGEVAEFEYDQITTKIDSYFLPHIQNPEIE